jgi:hypothetical protein
MLHKLVSHNWLVYKLFYTRLPSSKASISFSDPMTTAAKNPWIALLATSGLVMSTSLIASPAHAAPCVSGLLISTVVSAGAPGYSCEISSLTYTFYDNMVELTNGAPNAAINFDVVGDLQTISFTNLALSQYAVFTYEVLSPVKQVESVDMAYQPDPLVPTPFSPPTVTPSPGLPTPASTSPVSFTVEFDPDTSDPNNLAVVTGMSNAIFYTPAPLPALGAGLAFGFTRKLRRRINQVA